MMCNKVAKSIRVAVGKCLYKSKYTRHAVHLKVLWKAGGRIITLAGVRA